MVLLQSMVRPDESHSEAFARPGPAEAKATMSETCSPAGSITRSVRPFSSSKAMPVCGSRWCRNALPINLSLCTRGSLPLCAGPPLPRRETDNAIPPLRADPSTGALRSGCRSRRDWGLGCLAGYALDCGSPLARGRTDLPAQLLELVVGVEHQGWPRETACEAGARRVQPDDEKGPPGEAEGEIRLFGVRAHGRAVGVMAPVLLVQPLKLRPEYALEAALVDPGRCLEAGDEGRELAAKIGLLLSEIEEVARKAGRGGRRAHLSVEAVAVVSAPDCGTRPHAREGGGEDERPKRVVHEPLQRTGGPATRDAHQLPAARHRGGAVVVRQIIRERILLPSSATSYGHDRSPNKPVLGCRK